MQTIIELKLKKGDKIRSMLSKMEYTIEEIIIKKINMNAAKDGKTSGIIEKIVMIGESGNVVNYTNMEQKIWVKI